MQRIDGLISLILVMLAFSSCIRNFEPEILAGDAKKYVISGQVAAGDSIQHVNVSQTSPIGKPVFIPITGCSVIIKDDQGHEFGMLDAGKGDYTTHIDDIFLKPGIAFMILVQTPEGKVFESDFDTLTSVSPIDSVYYERKDIEGNEPGQFTIGIQFYLDVTGSPNTSPYYRWEAIETWEYHTVFPLEWWYDGEVHLVAPPDYSKNVCWSTTRVPNIFTLSTIPLKENRYEHFSLQYTSNKTQRLAHGYSLLVRQYSISEAAFVYWENLRANSNPEGGLYEKQPIAIRGNMHDVADPDNSVLGYFGASSVASKRIFIKDVPDFPLEYQTFCDAETLMFGLRTIRPSEYPAYLLKNELTGGYLPVVLSRECVNCLLQGGTTVKPDFWPF